MSKFMAQALSVIFHPLLMLTYMLILLLIVNPYLFGVNNITESKQLIVRVFITTFVLPAFAIFIMRKLDMIGSFEMRDKQDRIGPFIATGVFYVWVFRSVLYDSNMPSAFLIAALGTTIGLFAAFFINLFFKISLHATGLGGFVAMMLITIWLYSYRTLSVTLPFLGACQISINVLLMLSVFFAGLVGSVRLWLGAHSSIEIYSGFLLGLISQYIALQIYI